MSYRHFKGGLYEVLGYAMDASNKTALDKSSEIIVFYSDNQHRQWCRPKSEFEEIVRWPDGELRPRFVHESNIPITDNLDEEEIDD